MSMDRRKTLKLAGLSPLATQAGFYGGICPMNSPDFHFGWTTCLTYQAENRKLGFEYYDLLLDEMQSYGMTRLIVMMASLEGCIRVIRG